MSVVQKKILDIGGGPDTLSGSDAEKMAIEAFKLRFPHSDLSELRLRYRSGETDDFYLRQLLNLHAAKEAAAHPGMQYIVLDPQLSTWEAKKAQKQLPNLAFVRGRITSSEAAPFPDASFDEVSMNFVFTPALDNDLFGSKGGSSEEDAALINTYQPDSALEIPTYTAMLSEAARLLRPGGRLVIAEKTDRMERLKRAFDIETDHPPLLDALGLSVVSETPITDPEYSGYASVALDLAERGPIVEKRMGYQPIRLELVKAA